MLLRPPRSSYHWEPLRRALSMGIVGIVHYSLERELLRLLVDDNPIASDN